MNSNRLPQGPHRPAGDPLVRLFDGSGLVGLTDGELLARFVATGDEVAFEGLVARLGPMVLGVCRRMLGARADADADDAFQATFLVLVRRARAVGRGELIGPWLHGVAVRVCRKARGQAARRRARERPGVAADALPGATGDPLAVAAGSEVRATIDDAIARLAGPSRRVVILCDVEGLSRAEAADRLGWTPNMVRGRLARARLQLRATLIRRGCVPAGVAVLPADASAADPGLAALLGLAPPSSPLVAAAARAALMFRSPSGRAAAAALAAPTALHLADGVLRSMSLTSWKFVGSGLLVGGSLAAGTAGVLLAQGPGAAHLPAAAVPAAKLPQAVLEEQPRATQKDVEQQKAAPTGLLQELLEERRRAARARYEAQLAFYEEGRITIDRLIDASRQLMEVDLALRADPGDRRIIVQTYVDRLQQLHQREVAELAVGRATSADVAEAADSLLEARIRLARMGVEPGQARAAAEDPAPLPPGTRPAAPVVADATARQVAEWRQQRVELARRRFENHRLERHVTSRIHLYPQSLDDLIEAELVAATTPANQTQVFKALAKQVRQEWRELKAGEVLLPDEADRVELALLRIEALAIGSSTTADVDRRLTDLERKLDRVLDFLDRVPNRPPPTPKR